MAFFFFFLKFSSIIIKTLWRPIFLNCNYDINDYAFSSPFDTELLQ